MQSSASSLSLPLLPFLRLLPLLSSRRSSAHYSRALCLPIPPDVPLPEGPMSQLRSKFVWTGTVLGCAVYRSRL
jgi:hypothetical protein